MSDHIFKSLECQHHLSQWHERFLMRVHTPIEHREITTSFGASHVLLAGDSQKPPLVVLHGALSGSAHALSELQHLLSSFRLILPDIPGQSARAPQIRLDARTDAHARWLLEVFDGMGLERVTLCGISWGGFVALQTTMAAPARIDQLVLIVPAGIVSGSPWAGLKHAALPMAMYRMSSTEKNLRRFLNPLFTTWDDDWANYMGDALKCFNLNLQPPPLATEEKLRPFKAPTLVFGAENDIHFPGEKLITRAQVLMPHAKTELLPGSHHVPPMTDEFRSWISDRIIHFLESK
ncbi:putative carboxylesterase nap [Abditibacteriota bacterium]|nr:putative carboxylesterase nap [Abditibacteriota bacterium]